MYEACSVSGNPNILKLAFTGDIMCHAQEIITRKTKDDYYDFSDKFTACTSFFGHSDYVIGNLETPIADARYSYRLYDFNTPAAFAEAIKQSGITFVSMANNHCLDRGVKGLDDTILALDRIGLKHAGTNRTPAKGSTGIIEVIKGIKIGILSYTYGTNAFSNHVYLKKNESWKVNLFQAQELHNKLYRKLYDSRVGSLWRGGINKLSRFVIHKNIYCPVYERKESRNRFLHNLKKDIQNIKTSGADYVIMCLHAGGQYNTEPLPETKKIVDTIISYGVDAVIGNHEHVIHNAPRGTDNTVKVYSLGNFSGSSGVHTPPYDKTADYSILFNIYLSKETGKMKMEECTFTIAKNIAVSDNKTRTVLLYDLINQCSDKNEQERLLADNLKVYAMFTGAKRDKIDLKAEYSFEENI
jgi:poly-gamma-glutamate synthesis protein (capsule biosynthesis protein)